MNMGQRGDEWTPSARKGASTEATDDIPNRGRDHRRTHSIRRTLPVAPVDSVAFETRVAGPDKRRAGMVAAGAVALAVGAVATSLAASPAPATSGGTASTPVSVPAAAAAAGAVDPLLDPVIDLARGEFGGQRGFRGVTVTAVNGSSITLLTDDGWTRTITVTSSTEVTKGGQEIAVSDIDVGDSVRFRQERNDDGTYTVTAIAVVVPTIVGTVDDVTSTGFTVRTRDGSVWTITIDGDTAYTFGADDGSKADVVAGAQVRVQGESSGNNALDATSVHVAADRVLGRVTAKSSDSITVETRDGSRTIHVDGDTTYQVRGVDDPGIDDIDVGDTIIAGGRARDDGSLDASAVGAGPGRGGFDWSLGGRGGRLFPGLPGWEGSDKDPGSDADDASPSASPSTGS